MEDAICERIIKSIDSIILKDPLLDEFDVIHSLGEVNKSPVIHINHKLALESWCVKYVYKYAYSSVLHYQCTGGYENCLSLIRWTQMCLLLMPEVSTFWNIRKKMIKKQLLQGKMDLLLSKLVLTRKPKCIEAFQHRRWLFTSVILNKVNLLNDIACNNNINTSEQPTDFLLSELDLCTWTADRKQNNYHSWNHRLWIIGNLLHLMPMNIEEVYKQEYDASQKWVSFHVSEHSGMHYHSKILDAISNSFDRGLLKLENINKNCKTVNDLYKNELNFNKELLTMYPDHESLFYLRRVILLKLHSILGNYGQRASSPPLAFKRSCIETLNAEWSVILEGEMELTQRSKSFSQHHQHLAQKHLNWVDNVISF